MRVHKGLLDGLHMAQHTLGFSRYNLELFHLADPVAASKLSR